MLVEGHVSDQPGPLERSGSLPARWFQRRTTDPGQRAEDQRINRTQKPESTRVPEGSQKETEANGSTMTPSRHQPTLADDHRPSKNPSAAKVKRFSRNGKANGAIMDSAILAGVVNPSFQFEVLESQEGAASSPRRPIPNGYQPGRTNASLGDAVPGVHLSNGKSAEAAADADGVFSISGRRVVVAAATCSGHCPKDRPSATQHSRDHARPVIDVQPRARDVRAVADMSSSPGDPRQRRCQRLSETCSLLLFVPAALLSLLSPWLAVPLYASPGDYGFYLEISIWLSALVAICLLCLGCLVGNAFWYYDRQNRRWRCFLHCGRGPKNHYWGSSFGPSAPIKRRLRTEDV